MPSETNICICTVDSSHITRNKINKIVTYISVLHKIISAALLELAPDYSDSTCSFVWNVS